MVDPRLRVVRPDPAACGALLLGRHRPGLEDALVRDAAQLGHVPADVLAARVEAAGLADRVQHAEVGRRVGPGAGGPLPAAVVVGRVAVHQPPHEDRLAAPPVHEQVLGQEGGDHHPGAVVDPGLRGQLAHPGVHQRVARLAGLPGRQVGRVVVPAHAAQRRLEGGPQHLRVAGEVVAVEVAPAELAPEGLLPRTQAAGQAERPADLGRGAHAEAQVGGQARGGPLGEQVAPARVAVDRLAHERGQAPPGGGRPGGQRRLAAGKPVQPLAPERRPLDAPGRRPVLRQGHLPPGAVEGREDAVSLARGARQVLRLGHEIGRQRAHAHARHPERRRHPLVAGAGEGGDVAGQVDGGGAGLGGDLRDDPLRRPAAHHQAAPARAQLIVEGLEPGAQEAEARRSAVVAPPQQGRVEHEEADDRAGVDGLAEGGVVGDAQVAAEPDDGRGGPAQRPVRPSSRSRVRRWRSANARSRARPTISRTASSPTRPPRRR